MIKAAKSVPSNEIPIGNSMSEDKSFLRAILGGVETVIEKQLHQVEPTPIRSEGIHVVDNITINEIKWNIEDDEFLILMSLLKNGRTCHDDVVLRGSNWPQYLSGKNLVRANVMQMTAGQTTTERAKAVNAESFVDIMCPNLVPSETFLPAKPDKPQRDARTNPDASSMDDGERKTDIFLDIHASKDMQESQSDQIQFIDQTHYHCQDQDSSSNCLGGEGGRFREYQSEQWHDRYKDLVRFKEIHGHCRAKRATEPLLAQWIKRQRYQYRLKMDRRHSTLTDERTALLVRIGFIWDSHDASWEDHFANLKHFKETNGHCMVPSMYPENPQLATWVKSQRFQLKLYKAGSKKCGITSERIQRLNKLGFAWRLRKRDSIA